MPDPQDDQVPVEDEALTGSGAGQVPPTALAGMGTLGAVPALVGGPPMRPSRASRVRPNRAKPNEVAPLPQSVGPTGIGSGSLGVLAPLVGGPRTLATRPNLVRAGSARPCGQRPLPASVMPTGQGVGSVPGPPSVVASLRLFVTGSASNGAAKAASLFVQGEVSTAISRDTFLFVKGEGAAPGHASLEVRAPLFVGKGSGLTISAPLSVNGRTRELSLPLFVQSPFEATKSATLFVEGLDNRAVMAAPLVIPNVAPAFEAATGSVALVVPNVVGVAAMSAPLFTSGYRAM